MKKEKVTPLLSHLLISSPVCQTVRESKDEYFVGDLQSTEARPVRAQDSQVPLLPTIYMQLHVTSMCPIYPNV